MGVTGARAADLGRGARAGRPGQGGGGSDLPVGVGLGVRDGAQAAEVGAYADGVIVGSALVRCLLDAPARRRPGRAARLTAELWPQGSGPPSGSASLARR